MASTPGVTEDEIDQCSLPKAMRFCRDNGISTVGTKGLNDIKFLLKYELICKRTNATDATTFLAAKKLDNTKQREDLSDICENVISFAEQLKKSDGIVINELNKEFATICEELDTSRQTMMRSVPSVLVLGETGSGKSSFINLLLGEKYFPSSILSTTHVICEVRYAEEPYAVLYKADGSDGETKTIRQDMDSANGQKEFVEQLKDHIRAIHDNKQAVYKLAEVYLKCDILKSGLVIVDSPGIGETSEMNDMVSNYILNAAVFIYIIDSTNAGGMQDRVTKLVQKVHKKALEQKKICRPDSALFICNKWDEVKTKEREEVLQAARQKIKRAWPKCKDDQIICFSTIEADFIQVRVNDSKTGGGGMAPKFKTILQNIGHLIEVGQEILVLRSYSHIYHYIDRCIQRFDTHLSQLDMSKEERDKKYEMTNNRLIKLKANITNFFVKQRKMLQTNVDSIAQALGNFINEPHNRQKVCSFADSELPIRPGWKNAAVEVRSKVYNSLHSLIKDWEEGDTLFSELAGNIETAFEKEFPDFEKQIYQAEKVMSSPKGDEEASEESEIQLMPDFVQTRISHLSTGTKVALGVGLSPVLLVGCIVRLSVVGFQTLDRIISQISLEREYNEANGDRQKLKQVCQKYAEKTVAHITGKINLRTIIEEDLQSLKNYITQQQLRMERQIESDMSLLKNLRDEEREDEYVTKVSEPLKSKCLIIQQCLLYFMLEHMPSHLTSWLNVLPTEAIATTDKTICSGLMSNIVVAKSTDTSLVYGLQNVCVLLKKENVTRNRMNRYLKVLEAYRIIENPNIVHCLGFLRQTVSPMLNPVLEGLRCSLREYVKETDFCSNYDNNCIKVMTEVVNGLKFLHDKKLVHLDLSLDTVAVNFKSMVKLTNISCQVRLNIEPVIHNKQVCMSSYIHIAPKFFQNQNTQEYTITGDMFSVGIMMLELREKRGQVEFGKMYDIPESVNTRICNSDTELDSSIEVTIKSIYHRSSFLSAENPILKNNISSCLKTSASEHIDDEGDQVDGRRSPRDKVKRKDKWFQSMIKSFHPNLNDSFMSLSESRRPFGSLWRQTIDCCINDDPPMSANTWLDKWQEYTVFPAISLVDTGGHIGANDE